MGILKNEQKFNLFQVYIFLYSLTSVKNYFSTILRLLRYDKTSTLLMKEFFSFHSDIFNFNCSFYDEFIKSYDFDDLRKINE